MTARRKRIGLVAVGLCAVAAVVGLVLSTFNENLTFFFSPSQVVAGDAPVGRTFRIGGLVQEGTLRRGRDGLTAYFTVTDTVESIRVVYTGILPDLFKEGRGCVAQGRIGPDGVFLAEQVLAKHDENYMPVEAAQSIEDAKRLSNRAGQTVVDK
jgi:cytochrome c-type biogenesis protein CcmE